MPDNSVVIRRAPSFTLSGRERQVGRSPFYFAFDSAVAGVGRSEPGFESPALVQRMDLFPRVTLRTKAFHGFRMTPQVGLRATRYSSSRGGGPQLCGSAARRLFFGPPPPASGEGVSPENGSLTTSSTFFEPQIQYRLVRARDRARIDDIIRFDQVDTFVETHEIEYSVTKPHLFSQGCRRRRGDAAGPGASFLAVEPEILFLIPLSAMLCAPRSVWFSSLRIR